MVTDRQGPYVPHPVPSWAEVIAEKDKRIRQLEAELAELQRERHVGLGQGQT